MAKDTLDRGLLGEALVAKWLQQQGWKIVERRWRCRWGELDLVAMGQETLAFVEVKTRSQGNWDANGLMSITPKKQEKLWQIADIYLSQSPELSHCSCRFDIALVTCQKLSSMTQFGSGFSSGLSSESSSVLPHLSTTLIHLGQTIEHQGYRLTLQTYLAHAFDLCP